MCQALLELMEPEINKIKEEITREVMEKDKQEGIKSTVITLLDYGFGDMEIKEMLMNKRSRGLFKNIITMIVLNKMKKHN